ncbi:MAG: hypothetical protein JXR83_08305 [Deltaproteobacteria bacterium]|nr:hypothetical protein [Deltaproteobacteria bacterium]
MRSALFAVTVGVVVIALVGCVDTSGPYLGRVRQPEPGHVTWCENDPDSLDPAHFHLASSWEIFAQMFDALVAQGAHLEPIPALATSWDTTPDQRVFTFHLRRDARFSNGRPITAEDVRYSIVRVLHPLTAATGAESLLPIRHARIFNAGKARRSAVEAPPFHAGDVVELVEQTPALPDPDLRQIATSVALRAWPDDASEIFGTLPDRTEVKLVEVDDRTDRAYVYWPGGEGMYGWVAASALSNPNADVRYPVASADDPPGLQRTGFLRGAELKPSPDIVGVRAPDPFTLVIETEGPHPLLVAGLTTTLFIMPRETISRWPRSWTRPDRIVTSGAFHLLSWLARDRLELKRSETYWDRERVAFERLTVRAGYASALSQYLSGDCDALSSMAFPQAVGALLFDASGQPRARDVRLLFNPSSAGVALNLQRLSDRGLRRALALALNVSEFSHVWPGFQPTGQWTPGLPISELLPEDRSLCGVQPDTPGVAAVLIPGRMCYVPPPPLGFHPDEALAELAGARARGAVPDKIIFKTSAQAHSIKYAEWVAKQWKKYLGIEVEIRSEDSKTFAVDPLNSADAARQIFVQIIDPETYWLGWFRCKSPTNYSGFCDDEFEGLLDRAAASAHPAERMALVRRAEEVLQRELPIIPIGMPRYGFALAKPYMKNIGWYVADWRIDENWQGDQ